MNTIWNEAGISSWLEPIGWMLIHSLWQLAVIGVLFYVVRAVLQNLPAEQAASASYRWGCACLLAMAVSPMVTLLLIERQPPATIAVQTEPVADSVINASELTGKAVPLFARESDPSVPEMTADYQPESIGELASLIDAPVRSTTAPVEIAAATMLAEKTSSKFPWLVSIWIIGVLATSMRPLIGMLNVRRLSTKGVCQLPGSIGTTADRISQELQKQLGVALPSIRFVQSTLIEVPTVIGFFKPMVLLPITAFTGLTPQQLEMILAHEIAHVYRRDYIVNVAQTIVETLLFYHPAVWVVSHEIRVERENCCDDLAISVFGDAQAFARALVRLEQTNHVQPPALASNGGSLVKRVSRLIESPRSKRQSSSIGVCVSLLVVALFSIAIIASGKSQAAQAFQDREGKADAPANSHGSVPETAIANPSIQQDTSSPAATTTIDALWPALKVPSKNVVDDELLAVVNDQPIKKQMIVQESLRRHGNDVLKSLIAKQRLKGQCEQKGIVITSSEIDQHVEHQANKFGMSSQRYLDLITSKRNISLERLRENFWSEIAIKRLVPNAANLSPEKLAVDAAKLHEQNKTASNIQFDESWANHEQVDIAANVDDVKIKTSQVADLCFDQFGQEILQREIGKTLLIQSLAKRGLHVTQAELQAEVAKTAKKMGHLKSNGTPDVEKWLKFLGHSGTDIEIYLQDEVWPTVALEKLVAAKVVITDQEIHKSYESEYGPRANVLAIFLNDQKTALKVWNLAAANPTEEHFGKLAQQYSTEPFSRNHGVVPPVQAHDGPPGLSQAAFALRTGEISPIIHVDDKWMILFGKSLLVDRAKEVSFESVEDELRKKIYEEKHRELMHQEFEQLKADATINKIESSSMPETESARSNLDAKNATTTLDVVAKTSGVVSELDLSIGKSVKQGQHVVALLNQEFDLQLQELKRQTTPVDDTKLFEWFRRIETLKRKRIALNVTAPLEGKVLDICVEPGQPVEVGQVLLRLEVAKQPGLVEESRQREFRRMQSEIFLERGSIERTLKTDPRGSMKRLQALNLLVNLSNLNSEGKKALLTIIGRDIASVADYIDQAKTDDKPVEMTYPVADLIVPLDRGSGGTQVFDGKDWNQKTETGTMVAMQSAGNAISETDAQPIIELIKNTTEPDKWSEQSDGDFTIEFFKPKLSLVISADQATHDQVANLLEKLRELTDISIEVRGYVVVGSKEDFDEPALNQLPQLKGPIDGRASRYLQSLARGKASMKILPVPTSMLWNGQTAQFQIKEFGNLKPGTLSLAPYLSADKQSVKIGFSSLMKTSKKKPLGPWEFQLDPSFTHIIEKTPSGHSVAIDLSLLLKDKSNQRAFFVFKPIMIDEGK